MNRIDLDGRRAVVTGGAQGIGRAVAERLLASGAAVALWDRDRAQVDATVAELADRGRVHAAAVDVTDLPALGAGAGTATLGAGAGAGVAPLPLEHAASTAAPAAARDTRVIFAVLMPSTVPRRGQSPITNRSWRRITWCEQQSGRRRPHAE